MRRNLIAPAAITAGVVVSGLLVWQSSYAAFTATTDSKENSFTSGSVILSNDTSGAAKFNVSNMVPGSTGKDCITVDYTGSSAAQIRLAVQYGSGRTAGNTPLAPYLQFKIDEIADTADCASAATGTVVTGASAQPLSTLVTDTATTPLSSWNPLANTSATRSDKLKYRITYTLDSALADNTLQGADAKVNFVWTAKSVVTP